MGYGSSYKGLKIAASVYKGLTSAYANYQRIEAIDKASKGDTSGALTNILKANFASSVGSIPLLPTPVPMKKRVDSPK